MAKLKPIVFSASIENEVAIRQWVESIQGQVDAVRQALDDLNNLLRQNVHVAITLQSDLQSDPEASA